MIAAALTLLLAIAPHVMRAHVTIDGNAFRHRQDLQIGAGQMSCVRESDRCESSILDEMVWPYKGWDGERTRMGVGRRIR